ncbi:hypothetical protein Droror1_Dr00013153 [Drosera rotundifolia]
MNNALLPDSDSFSCRNIFNPNKSLSETGIGIHVVFPWRNTIWRCISSRGPRYNQDLVDLECGIFHMLRMTHIFPLRPHLRGIMLNYFFQDIQLQSGSDYKISISDENVLKFITLNCCSGSLLKVAGRVMCPGGASEFEKHLVGEQMKMDVMPNIWVEDVQVANPLAEARATLKALDDP